MNNVAIYTRVSTSDQSTQSQHHQLMQYLLSRGWAPFSVYTDEGVSGVKSSRPALDRLMADARQRKFDIVLVWSLDRFARSTKQLLLALDEFNALKIQFVSYTQSIDTTTPTGILFFTIVAAFAQFERDMIRSRVKAGLDNARRKGTVLGRRRVVINVDQVLYLRSAGKSWEWIAQTMKTSTGTVRRAYDRALNVKVNTAMRELYEQ